MPLSEAERAFRVVLAAKSSKNEIFCRKSHTVSFESSRAPNRFSANTILGVKHLIEASLDVSCFICGGGYGCFRFELGSDREEFNDVALGDLFQSEAVSNYLSECGIYSIVFWGSDGHAANKKKELLHSRCAS